MSKTTSQNTRLHQGPPNRHQTNIKMQQNERKAHCRKWRKPKITVFPKANQANPKRQFKQPANLQKVWNPLLSKTKVLRHKSPSLQVQVSSEEFDEAFKVQEIRRSGADGRRVEFESSAAPLSPFLVVSMDARRLTTGEGFWMVGCCFRLGFSCLGECLLVCLFFHLFGIVFFWGVGQAKLLGSSWTAIKNDGGLRSKQKHQRNTRSEGKPSAVSHQTCWANTVVSWVTLAMWVTDEVNMVVHWVKKQNLAFFSFLELRFLPFVFSYSTKNLTQKPSPGTSSSCWASTKVKPRTCLRRAIWGPMEGLSLKDFWCVLGTFYFCFLSKS